MLRHARSHTAAIVLLAMGAAFAGCGGDSDSNDPGAAPNDDTPGATEPDGGGNGDGGGGGGGSDIPDLADAEYAQGTAHVEISGDASASFDAPGGGSVIQGLTVLSFANAERTESLSIALFADGSTPDSITVLGGDASTTVEIGKDCDIEFTKSDATGLEGEFACEDVGAISVTQPEEYTITVTGTFSVTP